MMGRSCRCALQRSGPVSSVLLGQSVAHRPAAADRFACVRLQDVAFFRCHVRKGEKGIKILAPIVGKKKADDDQPENERREPKFMVSKLPMSSTDLAQTDGEDLPAAPGVRGNADTLIASLEIVQKTACQILDALTPANRPE